MSDSLEQKVIGIVARSLDLDPAKIAVTNRLEDLADDSIRLFNMVISFEKDFKTQVAYEDLMSIDSVQDIVNYIKNQKLA